MALLQFGFYYSLLPDSCSLLYGIAHLQRQLLRASIAIVGAHDPLHQMMPHHVAFIEAAPGFDTEAFTAAMRERLASFKIPKIVRVMDALPRNAMGKVEKQKLIQSFSAPAAL